MLILRSTTVSFYRAISRSAARRMTSELQRDWDLSVTCLEFDDGLVYFCSQRVLTDPTVRDTVQVHRENLYETFQRLLPSSISFAFTAFNPGDVSQSDVKNVIDNDRLEKSLSVGKHSGMTIRKCLGFFPDDSNHLERGFFVSSSADSDVAEQTRKFVVDMCVQYGQAGYFKYYCKDGCVYQDLVSVASQKVEAVSPLVRTTMPPCHPVFSHSSCHSVFHDVAKLQRVFSELKVLELDGVKELLDIATKNSIPLEGGNIQPLQAKNPVIVIEGLDATGKSTVCKSLSQLLNATLLASPPKCLHDLRPKFDAYAPLIRRAFYVLGNYILTREIVKASLTGPVVVDRYWHSSAAYAIASEVGCDGSKAIPPEGHSIYKWPKDLLKPEVVILLVVSREERQRRIFARGQQLTKEEMKLDENALFEERLLQCYKRMYDPHVETVDASGPRDDVIHSVVKSVRAKIPNL